MGDVLTCEINFAELSDVIGWFVFDLVMREMQSTHHRMTSPFTHNETDLCSDIMSGFFFTKQERKIVTRNQKHDRLPFFFFLA